MSGYRKIVAVLLLAQFIGWPMMGAEQLSCLCSGSGGGKMAHDPPTSEAMSCCRTNDMPHSQAGNTVTFAAGAAVASRAAADEKRHLLQEQKSFIVSGTVQMTRLCRPLCVSAKTSSQAPLPHARVAFSNSQYVAPLTHYTSKPDHHIVPISPGKSPCLFSADPPLFLMHRSFLI